ncbi:hypothetical protein L6164_002843 [Bauhinia variegata]|uniref:Uncharacterized protein n=1 Tax=Bauhinia variegata TaxID=167791 RepID=A0ACB9PZJ6_BAUVA|nr:hypothetical protein L6164_002843 [Bauhinia variegata]
MSKAYDRMEWEFLWAMMAKLGFVGRWIDLIMSYVSLVSYSILIKSSRADNPREERAKMIEGVRVCKDAPTISSLFFADDSLIFTKASIAIWLQLKRILVKYEDCSGQMVNFNKLSNYFSTICYSVIKENIKRFLDISLLKSFCHEINQLMAKFWWAQVSDHRKIHWIIDRKRTPWLSGVQALQPISMAERSNFLGRTTKASKKQSWAAMAASLGRISTICPLDSATTFLDGGGRFSWADGGKKCSDGVSSSLDGGFRQLEDFNTSLLAKQAFRLLHNPQSLTTRVLMAKYYPNCSILSSIPSLKKRVLLRIGDGSTTIVGVNPWLPSAPPGSIASVIPQSWAFATINTLFREDDKSWDEDKIYSIFNEEEPKIICNILDMKSIMSHLLTT